MEKEKLEKVLLEVIGERDFCIERFRRIFNSESWDKLPKNIQAIVLIVLNTFSIEDET